MINVNKTVEQKILVCWKLMTGLILITKMTLMKHASTYKQLPHRNSRNFSINLAHVQLVVQTGFHALV